MKFKVTRASDWEDSSVKEFCSLAELQSFAKAVKSKLIIDFERMTIVIYDDYVE